MRELQRQRDSLLYERIGLSDQRDEVLKLAREGALAESRSHIRVAASDDDFHVKTLGRIRLGNSHCRHRVSW